MNETFDIIEKQIRFTKKEAFMILVQKCIHVNTEITTTKSNYSEHEDMIFNLELFFKKFPDFINEFGKDRKYEAGVHALHIISHSLGLDIDEEECFIIFHIRKTGKFRIKESTLLGELTELWHKYKEYKLVGNDFSYAIKNLMRMKFINYRKGNLTLNANLLIRYKM